MSEKKKRVKSEEIMHTGFREICYRLDEIIERFERIERKLESRVRWRA